MKLWHNAYRIMIAVVAPVFLAFSLWQSGVIGGSSNAYDRVPEDVFRMSYPADEQSAGALAIIPGLIESGNVTEAEHRVEEILKQNPADVQGRFLRGVVLAEQGKTKQAIEAFEALIRAYPSLPEPYNNLAVLYAADNKHEQARDTLLKAINTHPSYATAYRNLSDIYAIMAGKAYNKALALSKKDEVPVSSLAMITRLSPADTGPDRMALIETPAGASDAETPVDSEPSETTPEPSMPAVTSAPALSEEGSERVVGTVTAWANAWASQDAEAYLGFYAPDFQVPPDMTRQVWEQIRRERINTPAFIEVTVSNIEVDLSTAATAQAHFVQTYRSSTFQSVTRKHFLLRKIDTQWRIVQETIR